MFPLIPEPGIYHDMDPSNYFADPCPEPSVTQSLIKTLLDYSPMHAACDHPRISPPIVTVDDEEKYVKARAIGDAVHLLLLGRGKRLAVGKFDSWRTKASQEWRAAQTGTPILEAHFDKALEIAGRAQDQLAARGLHLTGVSEVVLAWKEGGFWCRTMIDHMRDGPRIIDIKTTERSAAPHAVGPMVRDWAIQAAMHERGLDTLDPQNAGRRRHTFIVIEQFPPYALCAYDMPESVMHLGRKALQVGLDTWAECVRTGIWPAYPTETQLAALPGWQESRMLAREIEHEEARKREPEPNMGLDTLEEKRMDLPSDYWMAG